MCRRMEVEFQHAQICRCTLEQSPRDHKYMSVEKFQDQL